MASLEINCQLYQFKNMQYSKPSNFQDLFENVEKKAD